MALTDKKMDPSLQYPQWFTATNRDGENHWDIGSARPHEHVGRMFCIRGEPGNFLVRDERGSPTVYTDGFPTVDAAFAFVISKMLREPFINQGND